MARFLRLQRARIPYIPTLYPDGVNLIGFLSASLGLGQGARLYANALEASGIPHTLLDVRLSQDIAYNNKEFEGRFAAMPVFSINVVHINPDVLPILYGLTPRSYWDKRYNIGVWLWELEQIPIAWHELMGEFDELWAPSNFVADALRRVSKVPVHVVPYGIAVPVDPGLTRESFGLLEDVFLVICMFDLHSYASRKNPAAAVQAFFKAFGENHHKARLILKVHNASPEERAELDRMIDGSENVIVIDKEMEKQEVNSLIQCCDVLISLHRSEGFGLVLAEAMYLGVPVIATNWSANVDFMNPGNACMVDYTLIPTDGSYIYGQTDQRWAEPDVDQASGYLRRLYEEPSYRQAISEAAMASIRRDFSIARCAESMGKRYKEILGKHLR